MSLLSVRIHVGSVSIRFMFIQLLGLAISVSHQCRAVNVSVVHAREVKNGVEMREKEGGREG